MHKRLTDDEIGPISPVECLFCTCVVNLQHQECKEAPWVSTNNFLKDQFPKRSDECGNEVLGRINFYSGLHAKDCIYHQQCSLNFSMGKGKPKEKAFENKNRKVLSG